jgi:hypothetical protein
MRLDRGAIRSLPARAATTRRVDTWRRRRMKIKEGYEGLVVALLMLLVSMVLILGLKLLR